MLRIIILFITVVTVLATSLQQMQMIVPIEVLQKKNVTELKLQSMGEQSKNLAKAIDLAAKQSGLSSEFLIALAFTESTFKKNVISCKGYKGLMQIPHAVFYPDANMLIGAHIFNEKMQIAKGNLTKAICLYKGYAYENPRGRMQAEKVLSLYRKLRSMEV